MGSSAGANIAYHVGVRASLQLHDLEPLKIKGVILHHLFIGGVDRTGSEIRLADAGMLTLSGCDTMWDLSLPVGASREHEFCDPMVGGGQDGVMSRMKEVGWRVMVTGCYGDLLIDRQLGFAKMLELKGVEIECFLGEGYHGIELYEELKAKELFDAISKLSDRISHSDLRVLISHSIFVWQHMKQVSETIKYDDSLVGLKVKVWWPDDKIVYVYSLNAVKGKAPKKASTATCSGFNQILGIKEAKQETVMFFVSFVLHVL
ncbi:hypothetical protein L6452_05081 [Arctium lappa]|uniref:Uncharacterized protein n=1 Tax=Arctium lappa TaxID=4217 RepID=A0ACB9EGH3_ARCLA|nr:hypothetical protein L6452_05081 [Arctium lappa]